MVPSKMMIEQILQDHNLTLADIEFLFRPWILTVDELAARIRSSASKVYDLQSSGELVSYRPGRIIFDWHRHVVPFLESTETEKPKAKRLSGKKATLKHLDLS